MFPIRPRHVFAAATLWLGAASSAYAAADAGDPKADAETARSRRDGAGASGDATSQRPTTARMLLELQESGAELEAGDRPRRAQRPGSSVAAAPMPVTSVQTITAAPRLALSPAEDDDDARSLLASAPVRFLRRHREVVLIACLLLLAAVVGYGATGGSRKR